MEFCSKAWKFSINTNTLDQWDYAYVAPADMMSPVAIISPTAQNDYATRMSAGDTPGGITSNYAPTLWQGNIHHNNLL